MNKACDLKQYVDLKEYFEEKFRSQDKALELSRAVIEKRLDALNEWRQQNKDERETTITKVEYNARHQLLEQKIEAVQRIVYMGLGALAVIELILRFAK